jgi:hypothetical protein
VDKKRIIGKNGAEEEEKTLWVFAPTPPRRKSCRSKKVFRRHWSIRTSDYFVAFPQACKTFLQNIFAKECKVGQIK